MNKKVLFSIFTFFALFGAMAIPANAAYTDPLPNASCVDGVLKIYLNPQGVSKKVAVRLDNTANGWNGDSPLPGDVVDNNVRNSAFIKNDAEIGQGYGWWIHYIDEKGVYGPAKGGNVYCSVHSPINTSQVYEYPYLTLSWPAVKGAVRYGIRVDDVEHSWQSYSPTPFSEEVGDRIDENVGETSYRFKVDRDRKFTWWVHAIDKNGVYSEASRTMTIRTK